MVVVKGNHMSVSQAYPLYSLFMSRKKAHSNLIKVEDPNKEDERKRILRDVYWKTLEEYVKLDDLKFSKDPKALVTVLELECGEALEARTLCAYLKRGKHRSEEVTDFLYYGIDNQQMIKATKQNYEKNNPKQHPLVTTQLFNFEEQIPGYLPEMAVVVFNNLDRRTKTYTAWKGSINEGIDLLRKDGILICTLDSTEDARDFRIIISDRCDIHKDRKNIFAPKEYPETYDHIIVGKKR